MYHADLLAWAGLALSGRRGATRLVWSIRCSDMDIRRYGMLFRATLGAWKRIASRADAVIANSDAGAAFHRGLGCRFRRVVRIDNGVDTARFRPDPASRAEVRRELGLADDAVVAVLLGRVDPMKGHDAFVRSLDRTPEVVGLAAGLGTEGLPRRPNLRALGLRDDVPRLLAATDVLVSASLFGEGFPNAVVEAMGCGLPVVATDVGDTRRIVGEAGVVVGARDGDAMTAALHTLAADPDLRRRLGEGARRRVEEHFSLARMIAGYAAAYEDLIRR
jgi:glycosyltransferase involved in cell wall biosynthesis